ncbi:MAG: hypothetical protein K6A41_10870 [Bacteroidales bacterium]|nr:hypothetical protein [Bacteroidales bacterium]
MESRFPKGDKRACVSGGGTTYMLAIFDGEGVCHSRFDVSHTICAVLPPSVSAYLYTDAISLV